MAPPAARRHLSGMLFSSLLATTLRIPLGYSVASFGPRPSELLELYDIEACPYCRKVREALTMLDLDAIIRPSPKAGARFRPQAIALGGKHQFPLLVDRAAGVTLYESDAIVVHLYRTYGDGAAPLFLRSGVIGDAFSGAASVARLPRGRTARPSRGAASLLHLWSFESSPYSRRVRERLTELELPYVLHNVGKGSPRRDAFVARSGKMQVPYLEDPNTGVAMFESTDIVAYLSATYGDG